MNKTAICVLLLYSAGLLAADDAISRWAKAAGGREKLAAIKAVYREATIQAGPYSGTLKVWHTSDGRYRKEEQVATYSTVETFDGTAGLVQQGTEPPRPMTAAETQQVKSRRFANSNSMFFVFFPERHRGTRATEADDTIIFVPEGGIEWRVTLDPQTSLPRTMVHQEGERKITVTFVSYETVDGVQFEKEIQRSGGNPGMIAVIRFTKTVLNPPVDAALFRMESTPKPAF